MVMIRTRFCDEAVNSLGIPNKLVAPVNSVGARDERCRDYATFWPHHGQIDDDTGEMVCDDMRCVALGDIISSEEEEDCVEGVQHLSASRLFEELVGMFQTAARYDDGRRAVLLEESCQVTPVGITDREPRERRA